MEGVEETYRCDKRGENHVWVWSMQPDLPFSVGICMICGWYNGQDMTDRIEEIVTERVAAATVIVNR